MQLNTKQILGSLNSTMVEDIIVAGYSDHYEQCLRFHPLWKQLFVHLGDRYLLMSKLEQGGMICYFRDEMTFEYELSDEDDLRTQMSIIRMVTPNGTDKLVIEKVIGYYAGDDEKQYLGAIELRFEYGSLFFDGMGYDGIHVGGLEAKQLWLNHYGNIYHSEDL
jgi:hypothetical protein